MPDSSTRSPARLLAPIALVVAAVAVFIVLAGSLGGDDSSGGGPASSETQATAAKQTTKTTPAKKKATTYSVKTGDSLGSIAAKNGLTIEKLQELNPDVDPQALVAGQKIKLTE